MPNYGIGSVLTPKTRPITAEYERGHLDTFGERPDRHCAGCGRLPAWCECPEGIPGARPIGMLDIAETLTGRKAAP